MPRIYCWLFLIVTGAACTQELDVVLPTAAPQLVLNGLLHPDSLIQLSITRTVQVHERQNELPVVQDANVRLFENGNLLGTMQYTNSIYSADYYPKEGYTYSVEVETNDYPLVRALDRVPYQPNVTACHKNDTTPAYNIAIEIALKDSAGLANFYWLDMLLTNASAADCNSDESCTLRQSYYLSYSSIPDRFNGFVDNLSEGITNFDYFLRIDDTALDGTTIVLDIASNYSVGLLTGEQSYILNVVSASQHYDRYLKSSAVYFLNNEFFTEPNPFSETTQIYSNVENGTGIFAAYNSVSIPVEDFPCE